MFSIASEKKYRKGEAIFKEGDAGDWVYIILSGSVEVSKVVDKRDYILGVIGEGEIFGELSFIGGIKRTMTCRAVDQTTLGILDRFPLDKEFNGLSSDFRRIIRKMALRYDDLLSNFSSLSHKKNDTVPKTLTLTFKDSKTFIRAYIGNPNKKGLFIRTEKYLEKDEKFTLKLKLPDHTQPIRIGCVVGWTRKQSEDPMNNPSGMGIHFIDIDEKDDLILSEYIKKVLKGYDYKTHEISLYRRDAV